MTVNVFEYQENIEKWNFLSKISAGRRLQLTKKRIKAINKHARFDENFSMAVRFLIFFLFSMLVYHFQGEIRSLLSHRTKKKHISSSTSYFSFMGTKKGNQAGDLSLSSQKEEMGLKKKRKE